MGILTVPNLTLDLRGLPNPEPVRRLAEAADSWHAGDTVLVQADEECFASDFLHWCVGCDLELLSLRYLPNGETELTLRMPGGGPRLGL